MIFNPFILVPGFLIDIFRGFICILICIRSLFINFVLNFICLLLEILRSFIDILFYIRSLLIDFVLNFIGLLLEIL
jgi:hypothetical protein